MSKPDGMCYAQYEPSLAAAIIFTVLFAGPTGLHLFQLWKYRTWSFIPFVLGGIFEIIGYAGRSAGAAEYPSCILVPYIFNILLPLVAPALFAASIYMVLGRIIRKTNGETLSLVRVSWLTKIFVLGDVLSFLVQVIGGVILANADSKTSIDRGQTFITIGLVIQLVFFGLFIVTSISYDMRLRKNSTEASRNLSWETHIRILYISSALIVVRSIFRLIEYLQGHDGELLSNEIYLYVFDAALMLLVMIVFNWKHPAILIAPSTNIGTDDIEARNSDNFLMHKVDTR
ncbi:Rta-like protein [Neofusicoccum parvum]|nr:Rta-like protein [Neofusicoccum parvum]